MLKFFQRFGGKPSRGAVFDALKSKDYSKLTTLLTEYFAIEENGGPHKSKEESIIAFLDTKYEENDFTFLHAAVGEQDTQAVRLIEEKLGPEVFSQLINDQSNEQLWSPLLLATAQKDFALAKYLIEKGARVMQPMSSDVTMLHLAASNGDVRLLDYALA